jgi:thioredoxin-like negative regulator of GroEL
MVHDVSDANFGEMISSHDKVIVKFYAGWCGNCRLFKPKFNRLSNDERFAGVAFLDVDAEANPEARKSSMVNNLPFFATFKKGQLIAGQSTSQEEKVVELINQLL